MRSRRSGTGGIYYAAQKKSALTPAEKLIDGFDRRSCTSRKWKNEDSARSLLRVYAGQLATQVLAACRAQKDEADDGEQVYTTNEGDVLLAVEARGSSSARASRWTRAQAARQRSSSVQAEGPLQVAVRMAASVSRADPGRS